MTELNLAQFIIMGCGALLIVVGVALVVWQTFAKEKGTKTRIRLARIIIFQTRYPGIVMAFIGMTLMVVGFALRLPST